MTGLSDLEFCDCAWLISIMATDNRMWVDFESSAARLLKYIYLKSATLSPPSLQIRLHLLLRPLPELLRNSGAAL